MRKDRGRSLLAQIVSLFRKLICVKSHKADRINTWVSARYEKHPCGSQPLAVMRRMRRVEGVIR